jgi:hypothetical protein
MSQVQISIEAVMSIGFALISALLAAIWSELRSMRLMVNGLAASQASHEARINHLEQQCNRCLSDK